MKRMMLVTIVLIVFISTSVHALSWAIPFVVWTGNVYEVKEEVMLESNQIGKRIGKVKTQPDDMSGSYHGDASNFYPIGTEYYEIKGIATGRAIAVKDDGKWIKADYVHKARFHILNVFTNSNFVSAVFVIALLLIGVFFRRRKLKTLER